MKNMWQEFLTPSGNQDIVWELYHENSKRGRYDRSLTNEETLKIVAELQESLPFMGYPLIELPAKMSLALPLGEALTARRSSYDIMPGPLALQELATLLHYACGVTKDNSGIEGQRSLRVTPSAGALYPVEVFFYSAKVMELMAALYYYDAAQDHLRMVRAGDWTNQIAKAFVQSEIALKASAIIFITAVFERSIFKYGDRGYRFVMLEAGHIAQNINLVSQALGLGSLNVGGYFDREIDELLGIDGITHSTIYLVAIGKKDEMR